MKNVNIVALLVAVLGGCPHTYTGPDRPVVPQDTHMCGAGCERLMELGCPEAEGSEPEDPESCRKDCEYVQENGLSVSPSCWAEMTDCDQLETDCSR